MKLHVSYGGIAKYYEGWSADDILERVRREYDITTNRTFGLYDHTTGHLVTSKMAQADAKDGDLVHMRPIALGGG